MRTTRHHAPHSAHGTKQGRRGDLTCDSVPSDFLKLLYRSGSRRTDKEADDGQEENEKKECMLQLRLFVEQQLLRQCGGRVGGGGGGMVTRTASPKQISSKL